MPQRKGDPVYRWADKRDGRLISDDDYLRFHWERGDYIAIAKELGRTPVAVYQRAGQLGLKRGCPRGYAYLHALEETLGYDARTLRVIFEHAGLMVRRSVTFARGCGGKPRLKTPRTAAKNSLGRAAIGKSYTVRIDAYEAAVANWLTLESVSACAVRHGMKACTLRRWMLSAGYASPPKRKRWMLPTKDMEAVIAERNDARIAWLKGRGKL